VVRVQRMLHQTNALQIFLTQLAEHGVREESRGEQKVHRSRRVVYHERKVKKLESINRTILIELFEVH